MGNCLNPAYQFSSNPLYNLSEMEFKLEVLSIVKKLKETTEHSDNKTGEYDSNISRNVRIEKLSRKN